MQGVDPGKGATFYDIETPRLAEPSEISDAGRKEKKLGSERWRRQPAKSGRTDGAHWKVRSAKGRGGRKGMTVAGELEQ